MVTAAVAANGGDATICERALRADRVLIEMMMDVFEAVLDRTRRGQHVDRQMMGGVLRFVRDFVQDSHQRKMVAVMVALASRGAPVERFDAAELLEGYRTGEEHLRELGALTPLILEAPADEAALFGRAYRFVAENRRQLCLERSVLGGLGGLLEPAEDEALADGLACIERDAIGPTGREWYTQVALDYRDIVSTWAPRAQSA